MRYLFKCVNSFLYTHIYIYYIYIYQFIHTHIHIYTVVHTVSNLMDIKNFLFAVRKVDGHGTFFSRKEFKKKHIPGCKQETNEGIMTLGMPW